MSSSLSVARQAGLQRLCFLQSHKKSKISKFSLPGCNLVPLPIICAYKLRIFVGRSTTTQSTDGQSHPSVKSIALQRTEPLPALSNHSRTSFRSELFPFTSLAPGIIPASSCAILISGQKTTVFLSDANSLIASAICGRYGVRVSAMESTWKSPTETFTSLISISSGTVNALILQRYPSFIAVFKLYS